MIKAPHSGRVKLVKDKEFEDCKPTKERSCDPNNFMKDYRGIGTIEERSCMPTKLLMKGYTAIGAHCKELSVPDSVADTAKIQFQDAVVSGLHHDLNVQAIAAASIGVACEVHRVDRDYDGIFCFVDVSPTERGTAVLRLEEYFLHKDWSTTQTHKDNKQKRDRQAKMAPLQNHPTMTPSYLASEHE